MERLRNEKLFKLYVGTEYFYHSTFESAIEDARRYMPGEAYLRIEGVAGKESDNWWAYEYDNECWARS